MQLQLNPSSVQFEQESYLIPKKIVKLVAGHGIRMHLSENLSVKTFAKP